MPPSVCFTDLPAELRNTVYELVLPRGQWIQYNTYDGRMVLQAHKGDHNLLGVSRQIRQEASSIWFQSNKHEVCVAVERLPIAAPWISHVVNTYGPRSFDRQLTVKTLDLHLGNLEMVFPLVEMMWSTGLRRERLTVEVLNTFLYRFDRVSATLVEKALDLGLLAGIHGWDAQELEEEFCRCAAEVKEKPDVESFCGIRDIEGKSVEHFS